MNDYENLKEQLAIRLINTEDNAKLLKTVPHSKFLDLTIICCLVPTGKESEMGTVITEQFLLNHHISEKILFADAVSNTAKRFSCKIIQLGEGYYALTNVPMKFGAYVIIFPEVLEKLANMMGSGFYLIPSCVHEFMAFHEDIFGRGKEDTLTWCSDAILDGNIDVVEPGERLGDSVYYYSLKRKKLELVSKNY